MEEDDEVGFPLCVVYSRNALGKMGEGRKTAGNVAKQGCGLQ